MVSRHSQTVAWLETKTKAQRCTIGASCLILILCWKNAIVNRCITLVIAIIVKKNRSTFFIGTLTPQNWQKKKKRFVTCPGHKNYKHINNNYKYVKFDILSITAYLKFKYRNPFAHIWLIQLCLFATHHFSVLVSQFSIWILIIIIVSAIV